MLLHFQIKYVILINCGGTIDIVENLEPEEHVVFFIADSHRPTDVCNIYSLNDQVSWNILFFRKYLKFYTESLTRSYRSDYFVKLIQKKRFPNFMIFLRMTMMTTNRVMCVLTYSYDPNYRTDLLFLILIYFYQLHFKLVR